MRRLLLTLVTVLFLSALAQAQGGSLLWRDGDEFRGPVRSVRTEKAEISVQNGERVEGRRVLVMTRDYSKDGRRCEVIGYRPDGGQSYRDVLVYNQAGMLDTKETYDAADRLTRRQVDTFDEGGRIVEQNDYSGEGALLQRKVFIYSDDKDRMLEIDTFDGSGELLRKDVNTYDLASGKSTWRTFEKDGRTSEQTFNLRSPADGPREYVGYRADGTVERRDESNNNSPGRRFDVTNYDAAGAVVKKSSQSRGFDPYGNPTKIIYRGWSESAGPLETGSVTFNTITYY